MIGKDEQMECEYCKNKFSTKGSLLNHQKTAKYCLKKQNINAENHECLGCGTKFTRKYELSRHISSCKLNKVVENLTLQNTELDISNKLLIEENKQKDKIIEELKQNVKDLQKKLVSFTSKETEKICVLQDKLQEIAMTAIDQKNEVISSMVKKYVKKQPREKFDCSNVVYVLTTPSLKKERRYILGKAKNLTNRLSTYNKTDEHEVVYYQDCGDEESMNALEPFVFKKLSEYREQANRERFILPDNSNIDLFIDTIKNCFEFLK